MGSVHAPTTDDIPDAPFYVTMTDPFFSGWGQADEVGEDTVAIYVAVCDDEEEAEIVRANAEARGDQEDVTITSLKPMVGEGQHVMVMSRADSGRWYLEGGWS